MTELGTALADLNMAVREILDLIGCDRAVAARLNDGQLLAVAAFEPSGDAREAIDAERAARAARYAQLAATFTPFTGN